jgi:hypothetical protein
MVSSCLNISAATNIDIKIIFSNRRLAALHLRIVLFILNNYISGNEYGYCYWLYWIFGADVATLTDWRTATGQDEQYFR